MDSLAPWAVALAICAALVGWLVVAFIRVLRRGSRRDGEDGGED